MAALLNLNLLLAEDDENDAILIRHALKDLDCLGRLVVVEDGEQVLAYLQGEGVYADRASWPMPGVLVLDQHMPRLLGLDVICWIRSEPKLSKLPIVLWTASLRPGEQRMLADLQASYCPKAADIAQSARALEEAIVDALILVRGGWFLDPARPRSQACFVPVLNP
jgi:CheY-like chemotaxis protein